MRITEKSLLGDRRAIGLRGGRSALCGGGEGLPKVPCRRMSEFGPMDVRIFRKCSTAGLLIRSIPDVSSVDEYISAAGVIMDLYTAGLDTREIRAQMPYRLRRLITTSFIHELVMRALSYTGQLYERQLKPCYFFVYTDSLRVRIRREARSLLVTAGVDPEGNKDILSCGMCEDENQDTWLSEFKGLRGRGIRNIGYLCMNTNRHMSDGVCSLYPMATVLSDPSYITENIRHVLSATQIRSLNADLKRLTTAQNRAAFNQSYGALLRKWQGKAEVRAEILRHRAELLRFAESPFSDGKLMSSVRVMRTLHEGIERVTANREYQNQDDALTKIRLHMLRKLAQSFCAHPFKKNLLQSRMRLTPKAEQIFDRGVTRRI